MADRIILWALRLLWLSLPVSAGTVFADALDGRATGFTNVTAVGLWGLWGTGLLAILVPHTASLTFLRIAAPGAVAALGWAIFADADLGVELVALLVVAVIAVLVLSASIGAQFVNGTSYGDEVRLPLRPPRALLFGPIQLTWMAAIIGLIAGPLLLGAKHWILGAIVTIIGVPVAAIAGRALNSLAHRWLVFVPAGMVVHDFASLADPQLFRRVDIAHLGPALVDSDATDLTLEAPGLALELTLHGITKVVKRPIRGDSHENAVKTQSLLVTPSQPGAVLREAESRRITVG